VARSEPLPESPLIANVEALAREQGVLPFDKATRRPDFWPEDDSIDDLITFLLDIRQDASTTVDWLD
jgi:hypothetical protein